MARSCSARAALPTPRGRQTQNLSTIGPSPAFLSSSLKRPSGDWTGWGRGPSFLLEGGALYPPGCWCPAWGRRQNASCIPGLEGEDASRKERVAVRQTGRQRCLVLAPEGADLCGEEGGKGQQRVCGRKCGSGTPLGPEGSAASPQARRTFLAFWPPKCLGLWHGTLPPKCEAACLTGVGRIHVFSHGSFRMKLCFVNSKPKLLTFHFSVHFPSPGQPGLNLEAFLLLSSPSPLMTQGVLQGASQMSPLLRSLLGPTNPWLISVASVP